MSLLAAHEETRHDFSGPVVPKYRKNSDLKTVAYGTRDGLIVGHMDLQRPLFYVNATAYAGLRAASEIAGRLGMYDDAARWSRASADLRQAWRRAFDNPEFAAEVENERTAISGLWPFSIAEPAAFERALDRTESAEGIDRSSSGQRPLWTIFSVRKAHQWLRLGRPERARAVLDQFWKQSRFPGLYILWEGNGEENSFGLWKSYRGWVTPSSVTPHYWSSAEVLLLQISMIAEAFGDDRQILSIGAGVPEAWLHRRLRFDEVGTAIGRVSWEWGRRKGDRVDSERAAGRCSIGACLCLNNTDRYK